MERMGIKAMNLTSEFDEVEVMNKFKKYMINTLDVSLAVHTGPHRSSKCCTYPLCAIQVF